MKSQKSKSKSGNSEKEMYTFHCNECGSKMKFSSENDRDCQAANHSCKDKTENPDKIKMREICAIRAYNLALDDVLKIIDEQIKISELDENKNLHHKNKIFGKLLKSKIEELRK